MKTTLLLIALLLPLLTANAGQIVNPAPADPAKTVQAFYDYYLRHNGGADMPTIKATRDFFAPQLYQALVAQLGKPVAKDDAPDIDFDVFLDSQEVPKGVKVGKATVDKDSAKVGVTTLWSAKNETEVITVTLVRLDGAWKIKDLYYPPTKTTLTKVLHHAS